MPSGLKPTRLFWLALAWTAIALGAIGAVLPLMPTTVFLLIALWAGARASPRFRYRLLRHPRYGPVLRDWQRHGALTPRAKALACCAMGMSVLIMYLAGTPTSVLISVGACLAVIAAWLISRPSSTRR